MKIIKILNNNNWKIKKNNKKVNKYLKNLKKPIYLN